MFAVRACCSDLTISGVAALCLRLSKNLVIISSMKRVPIDSGLTDCSLAEDELEQEKWMTQMYTRN
jgi:hypothetical protein